MAAFGKESDQPRMTGIGRIATVSQQTVVDLLLPKFLFEQQHGASLDTSCEPTARFHHRHFIAKDIDGFVE